VKQTVPFGSWPSPVSAALIAGATIGLDQPRLEGTYSYWVEKRPADKGRQVIVRRGADGTQHDVIPPPFSARSRVHEYGGGVYIVDRDTVYFVNDMDQGIYRSRPGETPEAVFVADKLRFADLVLDQQHGQLVCVCEDHNVGPEPQNRLVAIPLSGTPALRTLHQGYDFYAAPTISPDNGQLAWLAWRHPNMPWDGTDLLVADIGEAGDTPSPTVVAGGEQEAIFQPRWSPDGRLYFVSDCSGWWNIYRLGNNAPEPVCEFDAEFGLPLWVFGMSTYDFRSADEIVCCYCQHGEWYLGLLCTGTGELKRVDTPYSDLSGIQSNTDRVILLGGSPTQAVEVVEYGFAGKACNTLKRSSKTAITATDLSVAESITFSTSEGGRAHGFFYAPANSGFAGPLGKKPPLIVISHGGPTAATNSTLNYKIQYWTSRGFAVLDINYRGSTGYGRDYRRALNGHWGIYDVADCEYGVRYLAERGDIDAERTIIRGSSAGGYTTLCALTFGTAFRAGASLYGIGDLETLVRDTHKFEARYLDRLVGPYPQEKPLYRSRSPINALDKLHCPVIFLQGLEDKVVPPSQAQAMVDALDKKGIAVAYITFEGEQHGFRQAQTIRRALEAELYFYSKIFGFEPAEPITPIEIRNLEAQE
jgi:dipeptidyl aminopeptidase/acylaminoacyl peptidase